MTIKGGTKQACAACKYQRRKCVTDCPLARYFPADEAKKFLNAHRLFGLSNILRILKQVGNDKKDEAMRSIIYESTARAQFPVHGCWGIICKLQHDIQAAVLELRDLNAILEEYKAQTSSSSYLNATLEEYKAQTPSSDLNATLEEYKAETPSEISTVSSHNTLEKHKHVYEQNDLYAAKSHENYWMKTLKVGDTFFDDYLSAIPIQELGLEAARVQVYDGGKSSYNCKSNIEACESSAESKNAETSYKLNRK